MTLTFFMHKIVSKHLFLIDYFIFFVVVRRDTYITTFTFLLTLFTHYIYFNVLFVHNNILFHERHVIFISLVTQ